MSATPNAQCLTAYYALRDVFPAGATPTQQEVTALFEAVTSEHGDCKVTEIGIINEDGKANLLIGQFGDDANPLSLICHQPEGGSPAFYTSALPDAIPPSLMKSAMEAARIKGQAERLFGRVLAATVVVLAAPELQAFGARKH